jgi:hypothetical protein
LAANQIHRLTFEEACFQPDEKISTMFFLEHPSNITTSGDQGHLLRNRDNPERLTCSATTRNNPVIVFRSSHSIRPSRTMTKYYHWRLLKQERNSSKYWRSCSDKHTIGLGMAQPPGLGSQQTSLSSV